jgi:hypothetical protein
MARLSIDSDDVPGGLFVFLITHIYRLLPGRAGVD